MRILYIIDSHPANGGAPISTCSIATEISKIYKSVNLILPAQDKEYSLNNNIKTLEIKKFINTFPSLFFNPIQAIKLANILKKKITELKPDIIHVHMPRAAWAIGLLKICRLLPINSTYIYTDRDHMESYRWPQKLLSLLLIKHQYNKIITLTEISASYWKKYKGKASITVIPNSAGLKYESYEESMRIKLRKEFNLNKDSYIVMFSGRMSVYKNWDLAKEIVLSLSNKKVTFLFAISTMNKEQEEEFKKFSHAIYESGVKHFMFHNVTQNDMQKYYYIADVFVLTSNKESFGRTAIEAMSRKCVVIGRNIGGLPEVIGKKENVLKCDVKNFHERILFYKNNMNKLNEDKQWFFERFHNKYTVSTNTNNHKVLYENNENII